MLAKTRLDADQVRKEAEELAYRSWGDCWYQNPSLQKLHDAWIRNLLADPPIPPIDTAVSRKTYLLQVAPQHETKVEKLLRDSGFDAYVPMEPKSVKTGHIRRLTVLRPMLPGYVFPIFDELRDPWQIIRRPDQDGRHGFEGVLRLFKWGDRPVAIPDAAIQYLHDEEGHARATGRSLKKAPIPVKYGPGAWVQLDVMPWTGLMGLVDSWIVYKSRIKVAVELFGRKTLIEVSIDQVRV